MIDPPLYMWHKLQAPPREAEERGRNQDQNDLPEMGAFVEVKRAKIIMCLET